MNKIKIGDIVTPKIDAKFIGIVEDFNKYDNSLVVINWFNTHGSSTMAIKNIECLMSVDVLVDLLKLKGVIKDEK